MPHARGIFLADPALFRRRRRKLLHQLQAVAQAHLAQGYAITGINVLNAGHASLAAGLPVEENSCSSSSARTEAVSAPRAGTFDPSPILVPFHSIGSAGTRNGAPSALKIGRASC